MKILADKARRRQKEYYIRLVIHPDRPQEEQFVEEFHFGLDVAPAAIKQEVLALLKNKYEEIAEDTLDFESETFVV